MSNSNNNVGATEALAVRGETPVRAVGGELSLMPNREQLDNLARLGKMFASSQLFKDTKQAEQCAVKILAGMELGLAPMAAMRSLHVFQGQVTLSAPLMASIIKRAKPRYDYRIRRHTKEECEIEFFEDGESVGSSYYSIADAKAAGLTSKDVWQHHPKNMLFSRALSNGAKWYCGELFMGPIYTPDEFGATVDADGAVIDVTPVQASSSRRVETVALQGEVVEGEAAAAVDWSPVGEVVSPGEGGELLATPEEQAEAAAKEEEARATEVGLIKAQIKRLGLKADVVKRLFKIEFGRDDMVSVPSWKLHNLALELANAKDLGVVLTYLRSLEQPKLPGNPAEEPSEEEETRDVADLPF